MGIEFIKWLCEKAKGFRHIATMFDIEGPDQMYIGEYLIVKDKIRWPLLLQRAIEGVNSLGKWSLLVYVNEITVESMVNDVDYFYYDFLENKKPIDIAKEEVLKYVYEQEKK